MAITQQFRLKLLIILGAGLIFLCMLARCQSLMPPTNVVKQFAAPHDIKQQMMISFYYTNIVFPLQSSTNLVDWTDDIVVTNCLITTVVIVSTNQPIKYYRAKCAIYTGPIYSTN